MLGLAAAGKLGLKISVNSAGVAGGTNYSHTREEQLLREDKPNSPKEVCRHASEFLETNVLDRYVVCMTIGRPVVPNRAEKSISTRLRKPVDKIVRAQADELGMPYGEYVSYLVAQQLGMPDDAPKLPEASHPQGVLSLKSA